MTVIRQLDQITTPKQRIGMEIGNRQGLMQCRNGGCHGGECLSIMGFRRLATTDGPMVNSISTTTIASLKASIAQRFRILARRLGRFIRSVYGARLQVVFLLQLGDGFDREFGYSGDYFDR
jgi:hypothetical protein